MASPTDKTSIEEEDDGDEKNNENKASTSNIPEKITIPLAAKDSEWVGIKFSKQHYQTMHDEEQEIQIVETDETEIPPLILMFPNVKTINQESLYDQSTTDVTKMLVGHRADFSKMKSSKKITPKQVKLNNQLETVQELPEISNKVEDNTDMSDSSKNRVSDYSEGYDIELDEEDLKPRHKKRRKTKSDLTVPILSSSHINLEEEKKPQSKLRLSRLFSKPLIIDLPSSQDSFGDDEREDDEKKMKMGLCVFPRSVLPRKEKRCRVLHSIFVPNLTEKKIVDAFQKL